MAGVHAFAIEMRSNAHGYCAAKFEAATSGGLSTAERAQFLQGLLRAIRYFNMPDRIILPLLQRSEVRQFMPRGVE
jgi:hypothetical protein